MLTSDLGKELVGEHICKCMLAYVTHLPSNILKISFKGWRDGRVVNNTGWSHSGWEFSSQNLHSGSHPLVTPGPGDLMPSFDSPGHQAHMWCVHTNTYTHTNGTHRHTQAKHSYK